MSAMEMHEMREILSTREINDRLKALGKEITARYGDEPVLCICVLKGAFMFFSDLIRHIDSPVEIDFVRLASYGRSTDSSKEIKFTKDLDDPVEGKNVLIIEDIVDTGYSMEFFMHVLRKRGPKSLAICALVDKRERRVVDLDVDFFGFRLEKGFLVGYGLDYAERYRELPAVYELVQE